MAFKNRSLKAAVEAAQTHVGPGSRKVAREVDRLERAGLDLTGAERAEREAHPTVTVTVEQYLRTP